MVSPFVPMKLNVHRIMNVNEVISMTITRPKIIDDSTILNSN